MNINGKWYCDRIFSAIESPLSSNAKVEHVIVSQRNKNLLKQLVAKDKMDAEEEKVIGNNDEETDKIEGEMKHNLRLEREVANEFSEPFRKKKIKSDMQLTLVKVRANSESMQKGLLKPDLFLTSPKDPKDYKEKAKNEVPMKAEVVSNNQVAPGNINSKSGENKPKSGCCAIF